MKPDQFSGMLSVFRPPLVFELTGREFTLVFDDGYDRRPSAQGERKRTMPTSA